MVYKTLHRKLIIEQQHEVIFKREPSIVFFYEL